MNYNQTTTQNKSITTLQLKRRHLQNCKRRLLLFYNNFKTVQNLLH